MCLVPTPYQLDIYEKIIDSNKKKKKNQVILFLLNQRATFTVTFLLPN